MNIRTELSPSSSAHLPGPAESSVFLIDKPAGPSSFRIVQFVRRALNIKKVGHAGTLDPFASGLLIVCAGRPATKLMPLLMEGEKEYEATIKLGIDTETLDPEGKITAVRPVPELTPAAVASCLAAFIGRQLQTPPHHSALKHNGKPLYYFARRGIEVIKEPRLIEISTIDLLRLQGDELTIRINCSKGTYVRVLAGDIGRFLGCGGHLASLRRTRSGPFTVADSLPGEKLTEREQAFSLLMEHRRPVKKIREIIGSVVPQQCGWNPQPDNGPEDKTSDWDDSRQKA
jgi:tRNA pseudouridine55 synthase